MDLALNMGLDVVAEGVENARVWRKLRQMGCTQIQGYYLTRPIPVGDFPAWLADYRRNHLRPDDERLVQPFGAKQDAA